MSWDKSGPCAENEIFLKEVLKVNSLQEIAIFGVICDLWSRHNITDLANEDYMYDRYDSDDYFSNSNEELDGEEYELKELDRIENEILKCIRKFALPKTLCSNMERYVPETRSALYSWADYLYQRVFFHYSRMGVVYQHANHLVWKHDGTIDELKTAQNMIKNSNKLENFEKFRIMSVYCLENTILEELPSLFTCSDSIVTDYRDSDLILYWNSYVNGTLDEMKEAFICAESRMMMTRDVDNIHAVEYFWNKLPLTDRIQSAELLIRKQNNRVNQFYQTFVLRNLNETELYQLFTLVPHIIIDNFMSYDKNSSKYVHTSVEYIFSVWIFIKNFVSGEHFIEILKVLMNKMFYTFTNSPAADLLCRIWDDCPDHLKQFALDNSNLQLIDKFAGEVRRGGCTSSEKFIILSKLLSSASVIKKNDFMFSREKKLFWNQIIKEEWTLFLDLVRTCGGNENDVKKLISEALSTQEIEDYSFKLLKNKTKNELNEFLTMCFSDSRTVADYKVKLLNSNALMFDLVENHAKWPSNWNETIIDILRDAKSVQNYKKNLAFSVIGLNYAKKLIRRKSLSYLRIFCDSLLDEEDDKKIMKNKLLQYCRSKHWVDIFFNFSISFWNSFLLWADIKGDLRTLKLSLPVDEIFESLLKDATFLKYDSSLRQCKFRYNCYFKCLNDFLLWYCETKERVKQFKLEKIYNGNIDTVNTLLRKKDTKYIIQVLYWFFDGDINEIEKFKKKFPRNKISTLASESVRPSRFSLLGRY